MRIVAALLALLVAFPAWAGIEPIDDPDHLLSPEAQSVLRSEMLANYEKTGVHIVVWLPALSKDDVLLDKAVAYFKEKAIGQKGVDNGVLLLVDWANRRARIEVGYGLEGVMTDAATKAVHEEMTPYFKRGDLAGGLAVGVRSLAGLSAKWKQSDATPAPPSEGPSMLAFLLIAFGIVGLAIGGFVGVDRRLARIRREDEARRTEARVREEAERAAQRATERQAMAATAFAAAGVGAYAATRRRPTPITPPPARARSVGGSTYVPVPVAYASCGSRNSCSSPSSSSSSSSSDSGSSYDSGGGSSGGGGSDSSW